MRDDLSASRRVQQRELHSWNLSPADARGVQDRLRDRVERGKWTPLIDRDEVVGAVLRTRRGVKPVFVSQGHRVSLHAAVRLVMACVTRFRLPETTRAADAAASARARPRP